MRKIYRPVTVTMTGDDGAKLDVEIPTRWTLCPLCEGAPAAGGCTRCRGHRTVRTVDLIALERRPELLQAAHETLARLRRERDEWVANTLRPGV